MNQKPAHDTSISQRVSEHGADRVLVRDVEMLEKLATGRMSHGAANGKHPRDWSLERWISLMTLTAVILSYVFDAGGRWRGIETDITSLKATVSAIVPDVQRAGTDIRDIKAEVQTLRSVIAPTREGMGWRPALSPRQAERPQPTYPRDSQMYTTGVD